MSFYRLLHLSLLAFNALSIRILSGLSGDYNSKNSKGNGTEVLLVASQVLTKFHRSDLLI